MSIISHIIKTINYFVYYITHDVLRSGGVEHRARTEPGADDPWWCGVQPGRLHHGGGQGLGRRQSWPHGESEEGGPQSAGLCFLLKTYLRKFT